jgi:hypothetical protein
MKVGSCCPYQYFFHGWIALVGQDFPIAVILKSHSFRHPILRWNALDDGSARRRGLYLAHNICKRQPCPR